MKPTNLIDTLIHALTGMNVVVSWLRWTLDEEMTLVDAASIARVGRYVPRRDGEIEISHPLLFMRRFTN